MQEMPPRKKRRTRPQASQSRELVGKDEDKLLTIVNRMVAADEAAAKTTQTLYERHSELMERQNEFLSVQNSLMQRELEMTQRLRDLVARVMHEIFPARTGRAAIAKPPGQ